MLLARRTGTLAAVAAVTALMLASGCGWIGGQPAETAPPTVPPPETAALLSAGAHAVEALESQYPDLDIYLVDERDYSDSLLGSRYGAVAGVVVYANHNFGQGPFTDPRDHIQVRLIVFPLPDAAAEYVAAFDGRFILEGPDIPTEVPVAVPGWPDVAYYWGEERYQHISYRFQHGPAAVTVDLDVQRIDSHDDLAERLGVTLDILQATLADEVPVDD